MAVLSCTKKLGFCAGHRLMNHEGKCANLHGHNYTALFTATGELDHLGRVIDFSILKEKVGGWIDIHWDHNVILCREDTETISACLNIPRIKEPFIMNANPTAENMAKYLLEEVCPKALKGTGVAVSKVVLWETESCYAEAQNE